MIDKMILAEYNVSYMNSRNFNEKQGSGAILMVAATMFILTFSALASIGFVPSYIDGVYPKAVAADANAAETPPEFRDEVALSDLPQLGASTLRESRIAAQAETLAEPTRIVIHSIGVDLPVLNPTETDIKTLDHALLSGSVRYPLSAKLNESGNIFIFGHSSHVAVVKNPMYKAFNRLPELRSGDTIKLVGNGMAHIYRVTEVRSTDVNEELINLSPTQGRRLTISTCDSFTGKTARFVVEAEFIGAYNAEE